MYQITWKPEDIQTLRPDWSLYKCEEWLADNFKYIRDVSIERGWDAIDDLLPMNKKPKHLWRDDGDRLTLNDDGETYSFDDSGMFPKYKYSYDRLVHDGFLTQKPI